MKFVKKFKKGLEKTRGNLGERLGYLFRSRVTENEFYEEMEEILISSDVGVNTSLSIVSEFKTYCSENKLFGTDKIKDEFIKFLIPKLKSVQFDLNSSGLKIIMLLGVNGSGKTTTAGKLAYLLKKQGHKVMLAAADTFRAAAIEQLEIWSKRVNIPIVKQQQGSDPGAVVFDAITSAKAKGCNILIADTAGRFHNKQNLVKELQKIDRIVKQKTESNDKYYKLSVLDATAGNNAYTQAESFNTAVDLDGVIITKMDTSARGGMALAVCSGLDLPIYLVGLGEGIDDILPFDSESFVSSLL